jgi:hypothetical protein
MCLEGAPPLHDWQLECGGVYEMIMLTVLLFNERDLGIFLEYRMLSRAQE